MPVVIPVSCAARTRRDWWRVLLCAPDASAVQRVLRWAMAGLILAAACADLAVNGADLPPAASAVSCVSVLLVDRFPWTVTGLLSLGVLQFLAAGYITATLLTALLVFPLLVVEGRSQQSVLLAMCFPAGELIAVMRGHVVEDAQAFSFILLGAGLSSGLALRRSRERVRRAEAAGAEALRAQRALIARELHDTLARTNTQIVLWARQAQALGPPDERVAQALDEIIAAGCSSVRDLRAMLRVLRQEGREVPDLVPLSSLSAAEAFAGARRALEGAGLRASVTCDGDLDDLPSVVATTLVRCLEESVANMVKYAAADAQCTIRIEVADGEVGLLVVNPVADGRRPDDAVVSSGYGLLGMQERASLLGGRLTHTDTGHQWVLALTLPLNPGDTP